MGGLIEFKISPRITSSSQSSKLLLDSYFQRVPIETGCGLSPFPLKHDNKMEEEGSLTISRSPTIFLGGLNSHLEVSFKNEKRRDCKRASKFPDPVKDGDQLYSNPLCLFHSHSYFSWTWELHSQPGGLSLSFSTSMPLEKFGREFSWTLSFSELGKAS